jgi:3-oxoacyl-[acyl-carrier-protein] synthase-3
VSAIRAFGSYLPSRIVTNAELAGKLDCTPEWILEVSGIEERRYAAPDESVVTMGVAAARAAMNGEQIGMILVSSGSSERRFPGPASPIARDLGFPGIPAIDLPIASTGGLFGMALAAQLAPVYGNILVVASEKMSTIAMREPMDRGVAPLFGDGAGGCLITAEDGPVKIIDSVLHSDGSFADDLKLEFDAPLEMNGRSVIMQASRKIPAAIGEVLERSGKTAQEVTLFVMHQANQNLMDRVAKALQVEPSRFYSNIRRFGNTSSASMLIAAAESSWNKGDLLCFAAFGAGLHWGALLAQA